MSITILSIMWLLPIIFMLHDFEEIILGKAWIRHADDRLRRLLPGFTHRILASMQSLSTSAFSLAVSEEFLLLSGLTWLCVTRGWYSLWAGILLGFFIHLLAHFAQAILFRGYIPALATSILASGYCLFALLQLARADLVQWTETGIWSVVSILLLMVNLFVMLRISMRFDRWLQRRFA
jgi:hypothetical protein